MILLVSSIEKILLSVASATRSSFLILMSSLEKKIRHTGMLLSYYYKLSAETQWERDK